MTETVAHRRKVGGVSNGCICCNLCEDLLLGVDRLAKKGRFDQLVIESTGISEPSPGAETKARTALV